MDFKEIIDYIKSMSEKDRLKLAIRLSETAYFNIDYDKKELFEKMISDEFIEQRFKEFQKEEEGRLQTQTPSKEELERYMLQMRKERIEFEKEQAAKREAIAREKKMGTEQKNDSSENDNLTGKSEK